MMYKIIAEALGKAGLSDKYHPQDYLNFYCLGKREAPLTPQDNLPPENRAMVWYFPNSGKVLILCYMSFKNHIYLLNFCTMKEKDQMNLGK